MWWSRSKGKDTGKDKAESKGTVLVTGATGTVGPVLIKQLQEQGYQCRALVLPDDQQLDRLARLGPEIMEGHLANYQSLRAAVHGVDAVIHMGCIQRDLEPADDPAYYFDINYRGTFLLLTAVAEDNPGLRRFVFTSSCAVYSGDNPCYLPIDEEHPQRPYNLYGAAKVCSETLLRCFALRNGTRCSVARLTTILLPEQIVDYNKPQAVIDAMHAEGRTPGTGMYEQLRQLDDPWQEVEASLASIKKKHGEVNIVPMDPGGNPWLWHLTDVRDAAAGLIRVLEHPAAEGDLFNIMGPAVSWYESAKVQQRRSSIGYVLMDTPCSFRYAMDTGKATRVLGWTHEYSYERMYDDALRYLSGKDIGIPY